MVREHERIIPAYAGSTSSAFSRMGERQDHPRIRGEHPGAAFGGDPIPGSSPHTRGARTWQPQSRRRSGDHPRIRGEHAYAGIRDEPTVGSSPHTRGARRGSVKPLRCERIIPAYAGSTNTVHPYTLYNRDHPRIRGEHDTDLAGDVAEDGSSPHTRGAPMAPVSHSRRGGIIPAYAGSTRATLYEVSVVPDHPRIRGEHFGIEESLVSGEGSSPHTRGARRPHERIARICRIIPAYAGSTGVALLSASHCWDHPRIRGEHGRRPPALRLLGGSSPHTRGAPCRRLAGLVARRDHPRIRGEHGARERGCDLGGGSSPHTRGARNERYDVEWDDRDHPRIRGEHQSGGKADVAGCGSSPHTRGALVRADTHLPIALDHPRIRGEHRGGNVEMTSRSGSSPHTRGARCVTAADRLGRRIIPAYAGSTPRIRGEHPIQRGRPWPAGGSSPHTRGARHLGASMCTSARDHPRIRGEHSIACSTMTPTRGSSPHTRGAQIFGDDLRVHLGIIPAYAGSTPT